jgi:exopolysaccharide biosynthesis polyprenyl glycosylphosphotransferase
MKNLSDLLIAFCLVLLTLPLMIIVAVTIKCDSRGPVFYRQERVGLGGRRFMLLKFRSMIQDAEPEGRPVWAAEHDPRVTRIGRFIRRTRIDELPQLFNVLRGDMSMIGPRPERPYFVEQLNEIIPSFAERHRIKPGITGWAQVNYPYGASIDDARKKLNYDLYYLKNRSFALDLMILVSTVRVVVLQQGAR